MHLKSSKKLSRGDQLALRHVAEIGPRGQEDGRRELRQEVLGQVEVEVEARRGRARSARSTSSMWKCGNSMPPSGCLGCGSAQKADGKQVLLADLVRRQRGERLPGLASGRRTRTPLCTGLPRVIVTSDGSSDRS